MKISVLMVENAKQIMLTPENDHERSALKMIAPEDKIEAVTKWGTFGDDTKRHAGYSIEECKAGYYRPFENRESLMFLITSSKVESSPQE